MADATRQLVVAIKRTSPLWRPKMLQIIDSSVKAGTEVAKEFIRENPVITASVLGVAGLCFLVYEALTDK